MMKTVTLLSICLLSIGTSAQTVTWYDTPDGTSQLWGDWAYKDISILEGQKIDSVFGAFKRPGYSANAEDFIFTFNSGAIFTNETAVSPWDYQNENNSLYGHWIDLTSFSYVGEGVVRIGLPTPGGAIWDSVGIATSPVSSLGIEELGALKISTYPNPTTQTITIQSVSLNPIVVTDLLGNVVITVKKEQEIQILEVEQLPSGTYFVRQGNTVVKFIKN